jgi:hypothetical protein
MSATRDSSQKIAFVYSNLYSLYQKGKTAAQEAELPVDQAQAPVSAEAVAIRKPLAQSSHVIKADDLNKPEKSSVKLSSYSPTEFIGKRVARPASIPPKAAAPHAPHAPKEAITSLKDNLKALNDLHSRLRFMLQELEDLVKN